MWAYFFKRASDWIQGVRCYWKAISYLIIWIDRSSHSQVLKTFQMVANFTKYIFLEFEKISGSSIFLTTSEGLLLNIPQTRSSLLWIIVNFSLFYFRDNVQKQLFAAVFKVDVLKNFDIFSGNHLCWSLYLIQQPRFMGFNFIKRTL